MTNKISYRVRNWQQYNQRLIAQGNVTLWFSDEAIKQWYEQPCEKKQRGRPNTYSGSMIELGLTLRHLFHLPLRGTQGFLMGLIQLLDLDLQVPHDSRLSRRGKSLGLTIKRYIPCDLTKPIDVVIDSTGLKIYGEGEWKMRTHGKQKRRTWRKYHVAMNPNTQEVIALALTASNVHDGKVMNALLAGVDNLGKVYADGAYTFKENFDLISDKGGKPLIPLRSGTAIVENPNLSAGEQLSNQLLKETWEAGGKPLWKSRSGYHKRSLIETHMFRFKTILDNKLKARHIDNQKTEVVIKANILNKMASLGMPVSVKN